MNIPDKDVYESLLHPSLSSKKRPYLKLKSTDPIRSEGGNNKPKQTKVIPLKINYYTEELSLINTLWDDLGVTSDYRQSFNLSMNTFERDAVKIILDREYKSLRCFSDSLLKISKSINERESLIGEIRYLGLHKQISNEIMNKFFSLLKRIRFVNINLINHFIKLREQVSFMIQKGKHDLNKLNKIYKYDRNYLIKLYKDMNFLINSAFANFIQFENNDPFFQRIYMKDNNTNPIPLNEDLKSNVETLLPYLLQDIVLFELNKTKSDNAFTKWFNFPYLVYLTNPFFILFTM